MEVVGSGKETALLSEDRLRSVSLKRCCRALWNERSESTEMETEGADGCSVGVDALELSDMMMSGVLIYRAAV